MIEVREATKEDVDYVIDRRWERGKRESKRIGFGDDEVLRNHLHTNTPKYFWSLFVDDALVVVMGAESHGGVCYTWFMATEHFERYGLALTKFVNRFTKEKFSESGEKRLELWSASDHPMADKWFNVLRFYRYDSDDTFVKYVFGKENLLAYKDEIKEDAELISGL